VSITDGFCPRMIIVTADPQSGKSTLIEMLIPALRQQNVKVAGILAKGLWKNGIRSGFHLIDLKCNQSVPLARRIKECEASSVSFEFFPAGIQAGQRALSKASCANADVVIVDEVGRLETAEKGWAPLLTPLLGLDNMVHIWVIRTKLVDIACRHWNLDRPYIVRADEPGALDNLIRSILEALKEISHAKSQSQQRV